VANAVIWVAIVALSLIAFAPLLWLMPSPRERRQARVRVRAEALGLSVAMGAVEDPDPEPEARVSSGGVVRDATITCAVYRLALPPGDAGAPFRVVRRRQPAAAHEPWRFLKPLPARPEQALAAIAGVLAALPADVVAIERGASFVAAYWREGDESALEPLVAALRALATATAPASALR
jgi:hypothetical protein